MKKRHSIASMLSITSQSRPAFYQSFPRTSSYHDTIVQSQPLSSQSELKTQEMANSSLVPLFLVPQGQEQPTHIRTETQPADPCKSIHLPPASRISSLDDQKLRVSIT
jgi:hypothetical protein